jgi:glycosyltransferase involved in cell wall biosynthesis
VKILQVLSGGKWAGTSVVVMAITRALIARGDQVWVVCLDDDVAERFREAGARVVRSPLWLRPISPLDAIPLAQLWALCLKERFDLVVTHTSKGGVIGRVAARLAGIGSILHHAHGYSFADRSSKLAARVFLLLEKGAARAGHMTVSVSEEHRRLAIRLGVERPASICTIHNGIDLEPFSRVDRAAARRNLGFQPEEIIIGALGRLATQKGFEYAIRAMPAVLRRFPAARLAIAGEGPLAGPLRALAQATGVADAVRFLGFRRNVAELLTAFDLFIQPSLWEGLSISLLEGMAARRPLVATDIPGNREQIVHEGNGLLVPPGQVEPLAEAICRLLGDPELAERLAGRAHEEARLRFSDTVMVRKNLEVYDALVARRVGATRACAPPLAPHHRGVK